ncbi:MAG: polysaccharide biosynthesis protein [Gemmataceae bacterium]
MSRAPIFLRVDAVRETGYERLGRCLILAAALQRRRRTVYFVSRLEPNGLAMQIKRGGNEWIAADGPVGSDDDLDQMTRLIRKHGPAAIFMDDADANYELLAELHAMGPMVISLDHLGNHRTPADIVVNPLLGSSKETYEYTPGAQLLLGRRYTMVRPEIRRHRPVRSQEPAPLATPAGKPTAGTFRAMVSLGDDDPNTQTIDLAKLLVNTPKVGKVDLVVRKEHPQLDDMRALAEASEGRIEVAVEPAEVTSRLVRCHFAVTAGNGWSNELACIGMPQLVIVQDEQHWPNAQQLEEEGCASILGWHENTSAQTIRLGVQNLIADAMERQSMSRCGRKLIDGRGPDRLVNAMEIMLAVKARREALAA